MKDSDIKQEVDTSEMETFDDTDGSEELEQNEDLPPPFVELVSNLDSYESPVRLLANFHEFDFLYARSVNV